ncbi:hypothetical protein [Kytococcus sp. Marseille-QA3725]
MTLSERDVRWVVRDWSRGGRYLGDRWGATVTPEERRHLIEDEADYLRREGVTAPPVDRAYGVVDPDGQAKARVGRVLAKAGRLQRDHSDREAVWLAAAEVLGNPPRAL